MRALAAIVFLLFAVPVATAAPITSITPSHDDCTALSVHGVWDCR